MVTAGGTLGAAALGTALVLAGPVARPVRLKPLAEHGRTVHPPVLPARFRGHWSIALPGCATDPVDEDQLWIGATSLDYYDTAGKLTAWS